MNRTSKSSTKFGEEFNEISNKTQQEMFDRKQLAKIKIVTPNVGYTKDEVDMNRRKRLEKGICTLEAVLQYTKQGRATSEGVTSFNSQEYETPSDKELKKIQVCLIKENYSCFFESTHIKI